MITLQINHTTTTDRPLPPFFKDNLIPLNLIYDFKYQNGSLPSLTYSFPTVVDPNGDQLLPILIRNMKDFPFLSFESNNLKFDLKKISSGFIDTVISLQVVVSNVHGTSREYLMRVPIQQTQGNQKDS